LFLYLPLDFFSREVFICASTYGTYVWVIFKIICGGKELTSLYLTYSATIDKFSWLAQR